MTMTISTKWFQDLDQSERKNFAELYKNYDNDPILKQLKKVLDNRLQEIRHTPIQDYDKASWAFYQAHRNGQEEMLLEIINLLRR